ncbi:DUF3302 domain-containing protein [Pseudaeromonas paramecii]|uniref:DUF3302 domain-containing protein n=1 Tax=Pseudaeromonas paramecii TaxID=2138166 RepID=A0ABP8QA79_9GAMM
MFLDYFALVVLVFVLLVCFYGVIAIHDIPYEISVKRNHPHQDAIHIAGWVSLFTLHVLWPFLWIWATLYREDRGWGMVGKDHDRISQLEQQLARMELLMQQRPSASSSATAAAAEQPTADKEV